MKQVRIGLKSWKNIQKQNKIGGESEIRTHGRFAPSLVFKTSAFGHSAISPLEILKLF